MRLINQKEITFLYTKVPVSGVSFIKDGYFLHLKHYLLNTNSFVLKIPSNISVSLSGEAVTFKLLNDDSVSFQNFINLVLKWSDSIFDSNVFKKKIFMKGLGFKIFTSKSLNFLDFKLGYSHKIRLKVPKSIALVKSTKAGKLLIGSTNKVVLGDFIHKILRLRPLDIYKGKGFYKQYQDIVLKPINKK